MTRHIVIVERDDRLPSGFRIEFDDETRRYHWSDAFTLSDPYCSIWIARREAWHEAGRRGYVPEALLLPGEIRA